MINAVGAPQSLLLLGRQLLELPVAFAHTLALVGRHLLPLLEALLRVLLLVR